MGTWGSGNFESDAALDHLSIVVDRLVTEIAEAVAGDPVALEPDEYWGVAVPCNLELLHVLAQAGHAADDLPEPGVVEEWKKTYMAVWERTVDNLQPSPEFKEERRSVLNRTFDQLADAAAGRS
ncbi:MULTISPECIES: DUF4259 domain-containing protein [unclassified Kitasatospora]|uniref:DUF4259 domain-containing protein n=1 Tax=unclassified Kitasatospora TaxID=2633591 RepID=UPI000709238A|nr:MULTISPECIES: DUF4259 domain-containing protein [unclassified Kitasatospora]KQV04719.1 hypothetical protein ASC99_15190 [Kitasatospora sp. Root107]KRB60756.1 hypothetical protein ASE03_10320 [Kitasatospora sp. Root187]